MAMIYVAVTLMFTSVGATANVIMPNGELLEEREQCFLITRNGVPIGHTLQSVTREEFEDREAWRIVIHQRLSNGRFDLRDEFLVDRRTLLPISLESVRGQDAAAPDWQRISITYENKRIYGSRSTADGAREINVPLTAPVWDGNLWGVTFSALPLEENGSYTLPYWQYDKGFGSFRIEVVGESIIQTPDGPIDAWLLDAGPDPDARVRYLVAKRGGMELGYTGQGVEQMPSNDCSRTQ